MAKPVGIVGKKDHTRKLHANREQWMLGKKLGREKQTWIWTLEPVMAEALGISPQGHWEKI